MMTTAREGVVSASERAETYLRMRAEAELRAALGFPRVKPPRPDRHARRQTALRRRRAFRMLQHRAQARSTATSSTGGAGNVLTRLARSAAGPLSQLSTRLAFRLYRLRWRWMRRIHRRGRRDDPPRAEACIDRVEMIATALTGAGALSDVTAMDVVSDLRVALAARNLVDQDGLLDEPDSFGPRSSGVFTAPIAPVHCFPIGVAADCQIEGKPSRIYFSAFVLSPAKASLEFALRFPPELFLHSPGMRRRPMDSLDDVSASDDRGGSYRTHFSGGGGAGHWDGRFDLRPLPPVGVRWLDVTVPGGNVVRMPLDAPAATLTTTFTPLPPGERADRHLDAVTTRMLLYGTVWGDDENPQDLLTASALLEAGILESDNPALARFVAAADLVGVDLPAPLAGIARRELPAEWLSLTARREEEDGPTGVVLFAAALPELDGAHCVLTGLQSEPEQATLHMTAQGWPDHHHGRHNTEVFRWTARDDLGGWYLASESSGSWGGGQADLELRLEPALNPQARALDIILTGKTGQVSVTVPLEWREGI
jgi:hypothetical protein